MVIAAVLHAGHLKFGKWQHDTNKRVTNKWTTYSNEASRFEATVKPVGTGSAIRRPSVWTRLAAVMGSISTVDQEGRLKMH